MLVSENNLNRPLLKVTYSVNVFFFVFFLFFYLGGRGILIFFNFFTFVFIVPLSLFTAAPLGYCMFEEIIFKPPPCRQSSTACAESLPNSGSLLRYRNNDYCFTALLNSKQPTLVSTYDSRNMQSLTYQVEQCLTTLLLYFQGFVQFHDAVTPVSAVRQLGISTLRSNFENLKVKPKDAFSQCSDYAAVASSSSVLACGFPAHLVMQSERGDLMLRSEPAIAYPPDVPHRSPDEDFFRPPLCLQSLLAGEAASLPDSGEVQECKSRNYCFTAVMNLKRPDLKPTYDLRHMESLTYQVQVTCWRHLIHYQGFVRFHDAIAPVDAARLLGIGELRSRLETLKVEPDVAYDHCSNEANMVTLARRLDLPLNTVLHFDRGYVKHDREDCPSSLSSSSSSSSSSLTFPLDEKELE